jgi:hypothetical protein
LFSLIRGEPSFYRGLLRPSLRLVLRGGIAYAGDLLLAAGGPHIQRMLSLEPSSSSVWLIATCLWASLGTGTRRTSYGS